MLVIVPKPMENLTDLIGRLVDKVLERQKDVQVVIEQPNDQMCIVLSYEYVHGYSKKAVIQKIIQKIIQQRARRDEAFYQNAAANKMALVVSEIRYDAMAAVAKDVVL